MLHILSNNVISQRVHCYFDNAKFKPEHLVLCICQSQGTLSKPINKKEVMGGHLSNALCFHTQRSRLYIFNQESATVRRKKRFSNQVKMFQVAHFHFLYTSER